VVSVSNTGDHVYVVNTLTERWGSPSLAGKAATPTRRGDVDAAYMGVEGNRPK